MICFNCCLRGWGGGWGGGGGGMVFVAKINDLAIDLGAKVNSYFVQISLSQSS